MKEPTMIQKTNRPLVTIGLPVFNGVPDLELALETLVAQDYPNIELIVSDNASEDATAKICEKFASAHVHLRYVRQAENIGALANFMYVFEQARGEYFMWAAHDDHWNHKFVSSLVAELESRRNAVLATPAVIHIHQNGELRSEAPDRPAPGKSPIDNLKVLLRDQAPSWIYGLYRTAWLKDHIHELRKYPGWGGDVVWIAELCLTVPVVGTHKALLFKRLRPGGMAPRNSRQVLWFWMYMTWYLAQISWTHTSNWRDRVKTLAMCLSYVSRICIGGRNPLSKARRIVKVCAAALLSSIPIVAGAIWTRMFTPKQVAAHDSAAARNAAVLSLPSSHATENRTNVPELSYRRPA